MAGRTGNEILLSTLEQLCREHRAMQLLLEESIERWRVSVRHLSSSHKQAQEIAEQFRVISASLQSPESDEQVIQRIVATIQPLLLPEIPKQ